MTPILSPLHVDRLSLDALTPTDLGRWRNLAGRAAEPNPFFEPEFVLPAASHLGEPDTALLVVREGDDWLGCVPVRRLPRWRRIPFPCVAAWVHLYCFLGTPLVDPDRCVDGLAGLVDAMRDERVGFVALDRLGEGGPVAAALSEVLGERGIRSVDYDSAARAALWRREEPTYLDETLRPKQRREMARLRRALGRDLGGEPLTRDRAQEPAAYEEFLALEASGWKGRAGTALASSAAHATFFREMCAGFAAAGRLELLALEAGGRTVAMKCNLLAGDAVYCFKIGYDEELSRYSPGIQLELDTVAHFHQRERAEWMDSCAMPDNQMINRLWPDRRRVATVMVPTPGALGAASRHGVRAVAALRTRRRRAA